MLRQLSIRNFVLVDRLDLDFQSGFGVLTGETGAGKSILIDALMFLLGSRADANLLRQAASKAEVSAQFDMSEEARQWMIENKIEVAEECLLRRVLTAEGRSTGYINGSMATAKQLRELGEMLVDIHGQHEHYKLLAQETQCELLDAWAKTKDLAAIVASHYRTWQQARQARLDMEKNVEVLSREREFLGWHKEELEKLAFEPGEWEKTQQNQQRQANHTHLALGIAQALGNLEEEGTGSLDALVQAQEALHRLVSFDATLKETINLLDNAQIHLKEAIHNLQHYQNSLGEADSVQLADLEQRISAVMTVARKHKVTAEELPRVLAEITQRFDALVESANLAKAAKQEEQLHQAYVTAAKELSSRRKKAAVSLAGKITTTMQDLAMQGGRLQVELEAQEPGTAQGMEKIIFLVSPHPAQPLSPLSKTASGGELSRIGLALQMAASHQSQVPTLIFDEVDAGIGGRVAEMVGRLLKSLGAKGQVLCVTHLPQVAAQASWQCLVKKQGEIEIVSQVHILQPQERIEEIARMLGGMNITETTLRHAKEMLEASR